MGFGALVPSLLVVVLDGYAAEWISRGIALGCSRWHCKGGRSPLREFCGGIRLEASGSKGRGEKDGAHRRVERPDD